MVNLLRNGQVSDAIVGYVIGIQLPIVAYRFGQHMAVYLFIFKCRREKRKDERRGYGIRLRQDDDSDSMGSAPDVENENDLTLNSNTSHDETETPSVRAIVHEKAKQLHTPVRVSSQSKFAEGDHLRLTIESGRTGYLYVVSRERYRDGSTGSQQLIWQ